MLKLQEQNQIKTKPQLQPLMRAYGRSQIKHA